MEEDEIALDKAIESGDTDLVQFVLMHLKKKLPLAQFFRVVNPRPVAYALIESEARMTDRELLKDLYYQDDRRADGAYVILEEALKQDVSIRTSSLHSFPIFFPSTPHPTDTSSRNFPNSSKN
jgi:vacuolar protein sorting-associated protein 16